MSKFDSLWNYIRNDGRQFIQLTFDDIERISGIPIDHSFLKFKKELLVYGYRVVKISLKEQTVTFERQNEPL